MQIMSQLYEKKKKNQNIPIPGYAGSDEECTRGQFQIQKTISVLENMSPQRIFLETSTGQDISILIAQR